MFTASEAYSIILVINRESMLIDPIKWEEFKNELLAWSEKKCPSLEIPKMSDNLFIERLPLSHSPRASRTTSHAHSGVYQFFNVHSRPKFETKYLISLGIPYEFAEIINRINSHKRCLSMIGILPNQIRSLMKTSNQTDKGFEELSQELFWKGYAIWKKRKRLMSNFWKNIAPQEWKLHRERKRKQKKVEKKEYQCQNPFHFLKRHCDLSQSMPTPCACSKISKRKTTHRLLDIRCFISRHNSANNDDYPTREDLVRGAHDRGKRARTS